MKELIEEEKNTAATNIHLYMMLTLLYIHLGNKTPYKSYLLAL